MSSSNGEPAVIKIGRKGLRRFALGDGEPVELDVVFTSNQWYEQDRSFRNEQNVVPPEHRLAHAEAAVKFAQDIFGCAVTMAEALHFLKLLTEESAKLATFFAARSPGEPSSPPEGSLRFTTD